jgi:hypothetical protein
VSAHTAVASTQTVLWRGKPITADIGGQTVALSADCCNYCGLDDIASDIWRRIERPVVVAALCDDLGRSYDIEPAAIEKDVIELLGQMREQGLIEVAG